MMNQWVQVWLSIVFQVVVIGSVTIAIIGLLEWLLRPHPVMRAWLWRACFIKLGLLLLLPFALPQLPWKALARNTESPKARTSWGILENSAGTAEANKIGPTTIAGSRSKPAGATTPGNFSEPEGTDIAGKAVAAGKKWGDFPSIAGRAIPWLFALWLLGVVVRISTLMIRYSVLATLIRRRRCSVIDRSPSMLRMEQLYRRISSELKLARPPKLYWLDVACSPFLFQASRPLAVFPADFADRYNDEECRMAIAHELAHFARRDLLWNLGVTAISVALFFFPCIWWAERRYRATQELACDWTAIKRSGLDLLRYAKLLVHLIEHHSPRNALPAMLSMAGSQSFQTLSERLIEMKHFHSPKKRSLLVALPAWLLVGLVLTPFGFSDDRDEKRPKKKSKKEVPTYNSRSADDEPKSGSGRSSASASASGFSFSGSSGGESDPFGSSSSFSSSDQSSEGASASGSSDGSGFGSSFGSSSGFRFSSGDDVSASSSNADSSPRSSLDRRRAQRSSGRTTASSRTGSSSNRSSQGEALSVSRNVTQDDDERIEQVQVITKSHEVAIRESNIDGIELRIRPRKASRKKEQIYEAESEAEFAEKHPSMMHWIEKYLRQEEPMKVDLPLQNRLGRPSEAEQMLREQLLKTMKESGDPQAREAIQRLLGGDQ